ncbi:MAG TPA: (4Fe-4S)-binding protein [Bacteroidales bacterium]|nr:(4Fe-4S)-binding protein [Bacteroidales bacterium]
MQTTNEIVILSGKGGTGKTSISAAFASLSSNIVLADCDVDAANMHLIMQPENYVEEAFLTGYKAKVNHNDCILCGKCIDFCRFEAITEFQNRIIISESACDGCRVCEKICPTKAIAMFPNNLSKFFIGKFRYGNMVHARLAPGEDNSGKLVAYVKKKSRELVTESQILLIDGPPGIGCPVIASLSGANKVVLVTEPTISGISDLKRIIDLLKAYKGTIYLIINKFDINMDYSERIKQVAKIHNITVLGEIPYNRIFTDAMINCKSVTEFSPEHKISLLIKSFWTKLTSE